MTATRLLDRLEGVRQTAPDRWIARCPAHEDRSPSLSIRELPDGRVLVHCFGACHVGDVLTAVGMTLSDLFADGARTHHAPPTKASVPAADLLLMVDEEINVAAIAAGQFLDQRTLTESDWSRLATASRRLGWAVAEIRKVRPWKPDHAA